MTENTVVSETRASGAQDTLKIVLCGRPGRRKTLQVANLLNLVGAENVVILSAEHGLSTIASSLKDVRVFEIGSHDELRSKWAEVKAAVEGKRDKWLVIDGGTVIGTWISNTQLSGADEYYDKYCTGVPASSIPERLKPFGRFITEKGAIDAMRIYGRVGRDIQNFIVGLVRLNCNLYMNMLMEFSGLDPRTREKTLPYAPDITGKVGRDEIMSKFDYVGYLEVDEKGTLVAHFDPSSYTYLCKTRNDRAAGIDIPGRIENFRLDAFIRLITGSKESNS